MTREELLNRISINPQVCFGKPCIKGRRIWVSLVLDFLASGMSRWKGSWKSTTLSVRTCWRASPTGRK